MKFRQISGCHADFFGARARVHALAAVATPPPDHGQSLASGRELYAQRAWRAAHAALAEADREQPLELEDLWRLAWSVGLSGDDGQMPSVLEPVYQQRLEAGDNESATRDAFWIGGELLDQERALNRQRP
jgi:hypothetical protein